MTIHNKKNTRLSQLCSALIGMTLTVAVVAQETGSSSTETVVDNNVSFSAVLALTSSPKTTTLHYGESAEQRIDIWAASGRDDVHAYMPGILLVHGGCWLAQYSVDHVKPLASALSQQGFNVFAIEYRRTGQPGGGWPGSLDDVRNAMKLVRETYPKMALTSVGHSAGGHLALLAATDASLQLAAVIGMAAITDVTAYSRGDNSCQQATVEFMGGTVDEKPDAYRLANVTDKRIVAPLYLLGGKADSIVPITQNTHRQARRFSGDDIGHFDWIHPQTQAYQHLLNTLAQLYD
ncbi:alpha/beta hydrolase family protein [Alteromonas oceanisediminis]|uniref:alpha/beta hydrolase family protein n=1 Tax=Alteromonas oceanisediminis TaxID=2836180 RepID=UPI001BDA7A42|nr:alpha/beta hydrolase [Alteromonas oceanisediminis]MBT0587236.1 alpha/beta hydrolase [Alteromonas oceanisediminis]